MVKKNTNEHDYFKNIKDFLTYHFNKTLGNETKVANVLEYCKLNYKSIGENEVANIEDENFDPSTLEKVFTTPAWKNCFKSCQTRR